MKPYGSSVLGLSYEARDDYILQNVAPGDVLTISAEADNHYDANAVAVYHHWKKIGYVPAGSLWLTDAIAKELVQKVVAGQLEFDEYRVPVVLQIEVTLVDEPVPSDAGSSAVSVRQTSSSNKKPALLKVLLVTIFLLLIIIATIYVAWLYLDGANGAMY